MVGNTRENLEHLGTLAVLLGLEVLGNKPGETWKTYETLGIPLGLGIMGDTKENLENPGTLGVLFGLGKCQGKPGNPRNPGSTPWPGNPEKHQGKPEKW